MNVLLVTIAYPPEIRSISTMAKELSEELNRRGHEVTVLTSWPRYNLSQEAKQRKFEADTMENGVRVIRIKTLPHHKVNYLLRGIAQVTLPFFFMRAFKKFIKDKIDSVIVYSPHLPLAQVGAKIKKIHGARHILNIQDIFPQNAIDMGILKNKFIIKFFECMEAMAYKEADAVTTHTEGGRQFLIEKRGVPPEKVSVVPNWIDVEEFSKITAAGKFRQRYRLQNNFVFLFAGVLGPSQDLGFIIEVARLVADIPEIHFLFVGDGGEKERLQQLVSSYKLNNVQFESFVSSADYPYLVKDTNVGLVCLGVKNKTAVIPGKILGFMAAAVPIVAFLNRESDGHRVIKEAGCGFSMISDDSEKAAELVRKIFYERDRLDQYGKNGYDYVVRHFSKRHCIDKIEQLIQL